MNDRRLTMDQLKLLTMSQLADLYLATPRVQGNTVNTIMLAFRIVVAPRYVELCGMEINLTSLVSAGTDAIRITIDNDSKHNLFHFLDLHRVFDHFELMWRDEPADKRRTYHFRLPTAHTDRETVERYGLMAVCLIILTIDFLRQQLNLDADDPEPT